jgi:hypothetical protein
MQTNLNNYINKKKLYIALATTQMINWKQQ